MGDRRGEVNKVRSGTGVGHDIAGSVEGRGGEVAHNVGKVDNDGAGLMAELGTEQAIRSEKLLNNYRRWKIVIISVISLVMIFILAFLLTMFICKDTC